MFEIDKAELLAIYSKYIVPWSIKILVALIIFFVGQLLAKMISGIIFDVRLES